MKKKEKSIAKYDSINQMKIELSKSLGNDPIEEKSNYETKLSQVCKSTGIHRNK